MLGDKTPNVVTRLLDFNRLLQRANPLVPNANPALPNAVQTTFFRDFSVSAPRKRQFGASVTYKF
jgi:hypothetical protein